MHIFNMSVMYVQSFGKIQQKPLYSFKKISIKIKQELWTQGTHYLYTLIVSEHE